MGADSPVPLVDHLFWTRAAEAIAAGLWGDDRMDYHAGFTEWWPSPEGAEERLIRGADQTVVTSAWLA